MTGIACCCPRAATGQAAAPPRTVRKSRRLMASPPARATAYRIVRLRVLCITAKTGPPTATLAHSRLDAPQPGMHPNTSNSGHAPAGPKLRGVGRLGEAMRRPKCKLRLGVNWLHSGCCAKRPSDKRRQGLPAIETPSKACRTIGITVTPYLFQRSPKGVP